MELRLDPAWQLQVERIRASGDFFCFTFSKVVTFWQHPLPLRFLNRLRPYNSAVLAPLQRPFRHRPITVPRLSRTTEISTQRIE